MILFDGMGVFGIAVRDEKGRFVKGWSGNPAGRPKMNPDIKAILKNATPKAAALLVEKMEDENTPLKERIDLAKTVLDRVYGKANQPIDGAIDGEVRFVLEGALEELAK